MAAPESLEGKVALVTGASSGIGREIVLALGRTGVRLALNARTRSNLLEISDMIDPTGERVTIFDGDIGIRTIGDSPGPADWMVKRAKERWDKVDIAIHAAGINRDNLFARMSDEEWDEVMRTKLEGGRNLMRAVQRPMTAQRSGVFIALTSISGEGNPGQSNYAAANMGLEALISSVDRETRAEVRFRALRLGPVNEGMMLQLKERGPAAYQKLADRMPNGELIPVSAVVDKVFEMILGQGEDPGPVHVFDGGFRRE